jgi:N-carbamoyl-L-amino-acid hydrolase
MEAFAAWLEATRTSVARMHGVSISSPARVSDSGPVLCDQELLAILGEAVEAVGATARPLASGAGHDAAWIARVSPAAMIFVPSRSGRSHAPDEWTDNDAIARGAAVLFEAVISRDSLPDKREN